MQTEEPAKQTFTLLQVMQSIKKTLHDRYGSPFWVKAEMNKLNHYSQSGHCYPELVEKQDGNVIAQVKANLWRDDYLTINNKFLQTLKEPLKDGIKILFLARISFDPSHGLALRIIDIDPFFTLGDLQREKQETISRLQTEGIFNNNKLLNLPLLPQRIAIISVDTSKGYADFIKIIEGNPWKYKFFHLLFPSLVQGDNAVDGIIRQLRNIKKVISHFDAVAIIRGGGGDIGLSCYNNYALSKEIALFPIPVITGIGHATNETVAEMISYSNAITPTKLAEYLIQRFHNFSVPVQEAEKTIVDKARRLISEVNNSFQYEVKHFRSATGSMLMKNRHDILNLGTSLNRHSQFVCRNQKEFMQVFQNDIRRYTLYFCSLLNQALMQLVSSMKKDAGLQLVKPKLIVTQYSRQLVNSSNFLLLSGNDKILQATEKLATRLNMILQNKRLEMTNMEKNLDNLSPQNILNRGFSITLLNGKAVKSIQQVALHDQIETIVADGNLTSSILSIKKTTEE